MTALAKSVALASQVKISYVEEGALDGVPALLLHGLGDSWRSYEPVLQYLPRTVRTFAVSQRGHGDSSKPQDGYRLEHFVEDLRAFLDAQRIDAAVLIGHSSHGLVSEKFAIDHPDRTLGLVLIGTPVTLRGNAEAQSIFDRTISKLTDPLDPTFARDFALSTLAQPVSPSFLATVHDETVKVPARVFRELFRDLLKIDLSPALNKVMAPALLV